MTLLVRFSAAVLVAVSTLSFGGATGMSAAAAAGVEWKLCLKARNGKYLAPGEGGTIHATAPACQGSAVLSVDDQNGGILIGADKVIVGSAGFASRWTSGSASGHVLHAEKGGSGESLNIHRTDRKTEPIVNGTPVALNGWEGKWVYDRGTGAIEATSPIIDGGTTFFVEFASEAAELAGVAESAERLLQTPPPALGQIGDDEALKYGDTVYLHASSRYMRAEGDGIVAIDGEKGGTPFTLLTQDGKATGQPVRLKADIFTLRIANSRRWLATNPGEDDGLVYRYSDLREVYNFNGAEAGSASGLNDVLIMRPQIPDGWVFVGDSIFRYTESGASDLRGLKSVIFRDNPNVFRPFSVQTPHIWADGNGNFPGRGAIVRNNPPSGFDRLGDFFSPWCCRGLEKARSIDTRYTTSLPGNTWTAFGTVQWTTRGQRYDREGAAASFNLAALVPLAGGGNLPMLWGANWSRPPDEIVAFGQPSFLSKQFYDDFSYYAEPRQLRNRPGTPTSPAAQARSALFAENAAAGRDGDQTALLNGMKIRLRARIMNGSGDQLRRAADGTAYFDAGGTNGTVLTIFKDDKAPTFTRATGGPSPARPTPTGGLSPARPTSGGILAANWKPYSKDYAAPSVNKAGELVVLQGLALGPKGQIAQLPSGQRPKGTLIFNGNNHDRSARIDVHPDGKVIWEAGGGAHGGYVSFSNINFSARGGRDLPLVNGWRNYGKGYAPARADKIGDTVSLSGLIRGNNWGHLATLPSGYRPPGQLIFSVNHHDGQARVDVLPDGRVIWDAGARKYGWVSLSGITFSTRPDQSLSLVGSWRPYGGEYRQPELTKVGNMVILSGLMTGTKERPAHLTTLPAGYRPAKDLIFTVNAHDDQARVDILPNGVVRVEVGGTKHGWVSVSGIVFKAK